MAEVTEKDIIAARKAVKTGKGTSIAKAAQNNANAKAAAKKMGIRSQKNIDNYLKSYWDQVPIKGVTKSERSQSASRGAYR